MDVECRDIAEYDCNCSIVEIDFVLVAVEMGRENKLLCKIIS